MVFKLRTQNPDFESGQLPPWIASGNVQVTPGACSGFYSAHFAGAGTGAVEQSTTGYPNRTYRLLFEVGAVGGLATAPLVSTVEFRSNVGKLLRSLIFTVPAADIPNVAGATPVGCLAFDLNLSESPLNTREVRLIFQKSTPGGADLILDAVYLIEYA